MLNRKGLGEQSALLGKTVDERSGRRTDNRRERVVLLDYDHHMVGRCNAKNICLRDRQGHAGGMSNTATASSQGHIRSSGDRGAADRECQRRTAAARRRDWTWAKTGRPARGQARGG